MTDSTRRDFGSQSWQPEYVRQNLESQAGYLSRVAATEVAQRVAAQTMQMLALQPGRRALEVGCGNGVFLPRLAEAVGSTGQVVGVDHAEAFVTQARDRMEQAGLSAQVQVQVADAYRLPFEAGSFDAAHCERVLMHLTDPTAALREMARVVRPGGKLVAVEPDWSSLRIDHPDPEALAHVYERMKRRHRDANIGLALRWLMVDAGLSHVTPCPLAAPVTDFALLSLYGFDFAQTMEELIAEAAMPEARLRAVVPAMEEASRTGRFYANGVMHIMCGTVG